MLSSDGRIVDIVNEPKSLLAERQVVGNVIWQTDQIRQTH